jgi:hypothetical protein
MHNLYIYIYIIICKIRVMHRGLPGWELRYNQKLAFHHGDTVIRTPSFPLLQKTSRSVIVPIIIFGDAT